MNDELFTLEEITTQLATWLMDEQGMTMQQALSAVYNSRTYTHLQDTSTGLMAQSDAYIYNCLMEEIGERLKEQEQ